MHWTPSHGEGCHVFGCKLQHKASCSCETLFIAGRFDQRQDKLLSSPQLGYQAWSCQSLLPWTCLACKCLQWDGGSEQQAAFSGGRNWKDSYDFKGNYWTPEQLARAEEAAAVSSEGVQTRGDTFWGFSWKKKALLWGSQREGPLQTQGWQLHLQEGSRNGQRCFPGTSWIRINNIYIKKQSIIISAHLIFLLHLFYS